MMELTAKLSPETHRIIDGGLTLDVQIVPQFISMLRQELIFFESEPEKLPFTGICFDSRTTSEIFINGCFVFGSKAELLEQ